MIYNNSFNQSPPHKLLPQMATIKCTGENVKSKNVTITYFES